MIWGLIIAIAMLVFAVLIRTWVFEVAEADEMFFGVVGGFIVLFIVSAIALAWLLPGLTGGSNVNGLVSAWVNNGGSESSGVAELPLYGK